jgi:Tfp pilus assembly protein PilN
MPQQINLCSPLQLSSKQSLSAQTMVQALAAFLVVGGILCATWLWNLQRVSAGFSHTLEDQARDIQGLKTALDVARANAAPVSAALLQQLKSEKATLAQHEQLQAALRQGLLQPGMAHSDRLQLIAQTIPTSVWVTDVKADGARFEVVGFTLEPSALNEWVSRLSASPLMQGLKLATVQVQNTALNLSGARPSQPVAAAPLVAASATSAAGTVAAQRAMWSFDLVSAAPQATPAAPEAKP